MKRILLSFSFLLVFLPSASFAAWSSYMDMSANYIEGIGNQHRIVLVMSSSFHGCGWNTAAHINLSQVGADAFKTFSSAVLSAWIANKKVSLDVSGCWGDRANIIGVRISK